MSGFGKLKRNRARTQQARAGLVPVSSLEPVRRSTELVAISSLRLDGDTQPRVSMDTELVSEYAERMRWDESRKLIVDPVSEAWTAITVFEDEGGEFWLADGFHRVTAARHAGHERIQAIVKSGGLEDAFVHSLGANESHGKRRTNKDKRRAVHQALLRESTQSRSDSWLAELCKVSQPSVTKYRKELEGSAQIPFIEQLETADGSLTRPRVPPSGAVVNEQGFLEFSAQPNIEPPRVESASTPTPTKTRAGETREKRASHGFVDLGDLGDRAVVAFPLSGVDCEQLVHAVSTGRAPRLVIVPIEPDSPMAYEAPRLLSSLVDDHGLTGPTPIYVSNQNRFYFVWSCTATGAGVVKDAATLLDGQEAVFVGQSLGGWS